MTYEKFRVGLTRLFIFITVCFEVYLYLYNILGMTNDEQTFLKFFLPLFMWFLFMCVCWIVKGFYFGKGDKKF